MMLKKHGECAGMKFPRKITLNKKNDTRRAGLQTFMNGLLQEAREGREVVEQAVVGFLELNTPQAQSKLNLVESVPVAGAAAGVAAGTGATSATSPVRGASAVGAVAGAGEGGGLMNHAGTGLRAGDIGAGVGRAVGAAAVGSARKVANTAGSAVPGIEPAAAAVPRTLHIDGDRFEVELPYSAEGMGLHIREIGEPPKVRTTIRCTLFIALVAVFILAY
jgi:hypothetical protein